MIPQDDFNDPHIAAIIIESGCRLVCTNDLESIPFIKRREFYSGGKKIPLFYTSKRNAKLLSDQYIVGICRPSKPGSKSLRNLFQ